MVYCKLKERYHDCAVYAIGTDIYDMTGEVVFFKDLREPELLKQTATESIGIRHIAKIYGKYQKDFQEGNFKEKLSYEIG